MTKIEIVPAILPFSVLMSVYNKEKAELLDKALQSVLKNQTFLPAELVLVEDGPLTEALYATIEKYRSGRTRLVSVKLPRNGGLGRALNAGLAQCSYEWVARMDSDDISLPDRFEKQWQYLQKHPETDVLGCALYEFADDERTVTAVKSCPKTIDTYIKFRSPVNHPTAFLRKAAVIEAGGYRHCPFMEDYHLWIRMYAAGLKITSLQEPLYLFRMDRNTQKRRGGWRYVRSETEIQALLYRKGVISAPRYLLNMAVRCGGRLIPGNFRAFLYRTLFRKRTATPSWNPAPTVYTQNEIG